MARFDSEAARLKRRRELLSTMQEKALNPQRIGSVGGNVVPFSPLEGLTQLGQALIQRNRREDLERDEVAFGERKDEETDVATKAVIEAMQGRDQIGQNYPPERQNAPIEADPVKAALLATDPALEGSGVPAVANAMLKGSQKSGGNPYFRFLPTREGYAVGDARTGDISMPEETYVRSTDDPSLQADITGSKETAKLESQLDLKPDVEAAIVTSKGTAEHELEGVKRREGIENLAMRANDILVEGNPTASGLGKLFDDISSWVGHSPDGSVEAGELKAIGAALVGKMPRFEGPQSDYDREYYVQMAGRVGDPAIPKDQRLAALEVVKDIWGKHPTVSYNDYVKQKEEKKMSFDADKEERYQKWKSRQ